ELSARGGPARRRVLPGDVVAARLARSRGPGRAVPAVPAADAGDLPLFARCLDLHRPLGVSGRRLGDGLREGAGPGAGEASATGPAARRHGEAAVNLLSLIGLGSLCRLPPTCLFPSSAHE